MLADTHWDRATLTFAEGDPVSEENEERLVVILESSYDSDIRGFLDDLLHNGVEPGVEIPYLLDRKEQITEWGASGAVVDIAVLVATNAFGGLLTQAVMARLAKRKTKPVSESLRNLEEEDAIEAAKFYLEVKYNIGPEVFEVVSYSEQPDQRVVSLRDSRYEYTVTLYQDISLAGLAATVAWRKL